MTDATDRWRLVLGRYAEDELPLGGDEGLGQVDEALDFLYGREYAGRGGRPDSGGGEASGEGSGGAGDSQVTLVRWLGEVRELFPRETAEEIVGDALERYELTGLVSDPEVLARLEPNLALLRTLVSVRSHLSPPVLDVARRVIRTVVDELTRRLSMDMRPALSGRINPHRHSPVAIAANFDPAGTVRANLRHWDAERGRLVLETVRFFERNARRLPWDIIVAVDQSGSMVDAVIHSAVMAGILTGLPGFRVRLVAFDTNVVDLSDVADDPVEVLMNVQLGGGTAIARALGYCATLIENPSRTVVVLVSDFGEGQPPEELVAVVRGLSEARVTMLGLASLDGRADAAYDRRIAGLCADAGMEIAALTPGRLAEWLVRVTS